MERIQRTLLVISMVLMAAGTLLAGPSVDHRLAAEINANPLVLTPVAITFAAKPKSGDFLMLQSLGITGGYALTELPIVLTRVNRTQFNALKTKSSIRSLYGDATMKLLDLESRTISGVENLIRDIEVTAINNGLPMTGRNIGVSYIDTGIDATHPDLKLGENVIQNVLFATAEVPLNLPSGFLPSLPIENLPHTDIEGGHGTFGAAVTAGTGSASGGLYAGMAPGAKLIGITAGNDAGLSTFAILQAMDYTLVKQYEYNIRVCNNSWGTTLAVRPYDPNDPINTATRMMHDRNITVVFAAGNDGDAPDMINPYSVAPWVISVAAAEKRGLGTPAGFSSRGNDNGTGSDTAGQPADPNTPPNLRPDIIGSGVDIKSARSKSPGVTNTAGTIPIFVGANDLSTIPPAMLPYYTTSQGTSFSAPQVSGIVAMMLEANPLLTPDDVVTILRQTATPMPYEERVVGAGYVDAHNAVRTAMQLAMTSHPVNLFPSDDPNAPQIVDAADDQLGTTAQDIREGYFKYDPATDQIVYRLKVSDASVTTPNMRWTMQSNFGETQIFVTASVDETVTTYKYGRITTLATGTQNQETLGAADAGQMTGNEITIKLAVDKINAAVGGDIRGTTSTSTQARSQILIGSSLSGGLLLNSDSAAGTDFNVSGDQEADPDPDPTPTPTPDPTPSPDPDPSPGGGSNGGGRFDERYSGTVLPGDDNVEVTFELRRSLVDAQMTQNHGNQPLTFELLDANGNLIATAAGRKIRLDGLTPGTYRYRVSGSVTRAVDFTIMSGQGQ
jgi:subtilisin family serine protease